MHFSGSHRIDRSLIATVDPHLTQRGSIALNGKPLQIRLPESAVVTRW